MSQYSGLFCKICHLKMSTVSGHHCTFDFVERWRIFSGNDLIVFNHICDEDLDRNKCPTNSWAGAWADSKANPVIILFC